MRNTPPNNIHQTNLHTTINHNHITRSSYHFHIPSYFIAWLIAHLSFTCVPPPLSHLTCPEHISYILLPTLTSNEGDRRERSERCERLTWRLVWNIFVNPSIVGQMVVNTCSVRMRGGGSLPPCFSMNHPILTWFLLKRISVGWGSEAVSSGMYEPGNPRESTRLQ